MTVDLNDLVEIRVWVPTATIEEQLKYHLDNGLNAKEASDKVLDYYNGTPLRSIASGVILDEAQRMERARTRNLENVVLNPRKNPVVGEGPTKNRKEDRHRASYLKARALISRRTFKYEIGKSVTWGEATEWQHQARIVWQLALTDHIGRDVARHRRAMEMIQHYGVTCLDEIPDWQDRFGVGWQDSDTLTAIEGSVV